MATQPIPDPTEDPKIQFGKFDGYTNTVDRHALGPRDLSLALDIDLDDVGLAHRRRGRTQVANGNFHSLWNAEDGTVYGVKNGVLGIINPDYSFVSLGFIVGGSYDAGFGAVAFCQIKHKIYFSFPNGSGIIDHALGTIGPWGPAQDFWYSPVVDPTSTLPPIRGKLLGAPPYANYLTYYNGRIYLATGNMVWATEYFLYNFVDKTKGFFQFEGEVTMLMAVMDGIYVGTTEGLWFLAGGSFAEMKRLRVMDSPVIPGSAVLIPAELANPPQVGTEAVTPMEVSVAFMTTRGFCVGEDGGKASNLTENKVFFPVSKRAAAFFRRQDGRNHYVVCADSEGQPVNGAAFGKFVDPEIRRGNVTWIDIGDQARAGDESQ